MKIAILGSLLSHPSLTGVEKYLYHLVQALSKLDHLKLTLVSHVQIPKERVPEHIDLIETPATMSSMRRCFYRLTGLRYALRAVDIIHCPTVIAPFFFNMRGRPKLVMTVHDLVPAIYPEFSTFIKKIYYRYALRFVFKRVDHFIVPSHSVRKDLINRYQLEPNRIDVIHEGVSKRYRPLSTAKGDYILAVSTVEPRKNFKRIIESYVYLKRTRAISQRLIIVGKKGWACEGVYHIPEPYGRSIIFKGYVSEDELIALYQRANVFVYPSLHEGFGLPVVEAMACGCPVVTSNLSSLPEVAGQACLLVDPNRIDDIAGAIMRILDDAPLTSSLIEKGLERARHFDWSRCARQTTKVYETVINR